MTRFTHKTVSRRGFLQTTAMTVAASSVAGAGSAPAIPAPEPHEARFYKPLSDNKIQCALCPWQCVVVPGKRGNCGVRENRNGKYYSLVYGKPCTAHNDPIEKKPFFHVYPGSKAFSIATVGCNIECKFCQNHLISQENPDNIRSPFVRPDQIAKSAVQCKSRTVAYTYSEPTVFFEYMVDCAKAVKEMGLGNVVVSNGFISAKPLKELCSLMTAIKIDLKAFSQQFYAKNCGGQLKPVLETLKRLSDSDTWFEIVVLLIPTLNDNMDEIKRMSEWIVKELRPDVPLHFTRFHPAYKMQNLPPTPVKTMQNARKIAVAAGCNFVYGGNMAGIKGENTHCPQCKIMVVNRYGHAIVSNELKNGKCHKCGKPIPGVWT